MKFKKQYAFVTSLVFSTILLGCDAGVRGKYALISWEEKDDKVYWTSIRSLWPDEKRCAWALYNSEGELKDPKLTCVYVNAIAMMPTPVVGWKNGWPAGYTKYEDRLDDFSVTHSPLALNHPSNAEEEKK